MPRKRDSLSAYLRVQREFDRELYSLLSRAASDAEKQMRAILGDNVGDVIRREQLRAAVVEMHREMADIMERAGLAIRASQHRAAAAAVDVFLEYEKVLFTALKGDTARVAAYLESARATASYGIDAALQRLQGRSYVPLSERVYNTTQLANGVVDRTVNSALARGLNAREIAKEVSGLINPNVRGGVSYAAMRLGRTEVNNAYHAIQVRTAQTTPWVTAVQWLTSGSHPEPDECDEYANNVHFEGGAEGYFKPNEVPAKPHPNCLCYTVPVTVDEDTFLDKWAAGDYDSYLASVESGTVYA